MSEERIHLENPAISHIYGKTVIQERIMDKKDQVKILEYEIISAADILIKKGRKNMIIMRRGSELLMFR